MLNKTTEPKTFCIHELKLINFTGPSLWSGGGEPRLGTDGHCLQPVTSGNNFNQWIWVCYTRGLSTTCVTICDISGCIIT